MDVMEAGELVRRLDAAVNAGNVEAITLQVQREIENALAPGRLRLDERFRRTRPDRYARRLLHRDPAGRYTVLVLAWAPGQATPIHDHPNLWSVEGVLEGELEVTQYAPIKEEAHRCRFAPVESRLRGERHRWRESRHARASGTPLNGVDCRTIATRATGRRKADPYPSQYSHRESRSSTPRVSRLLVWCRKPRNGARSTTQLWVTSSRGWRICRFQGRKFRRLPLNPSSTTSSPSR